MGDVPIRPGATAAAAMLRRYSYEKLTGRCRCATSASAAHRRRPARVPTTRNRARPATEHDRAQTCHTTRRRRRNGRSSGRIAAAWMVGRWVEGGVTHAAIVRGAGRGENDCGEAEGLAGNLLPEAISPDEIADGVRRLTQRHACGACGSGSLCFVSNAHATRARPISLARYRCVSATRSKGSSDVASLGNSATPAE